MSLFKKKIPAVCPKCGKADGWHVLPEEPTDSYVLNTAAAVNSFSPAPIRGTFGQNMTAGVGKRSKKLRYQCDSCGCQRTY